MTQKSDKPKRKAPRTAWKPGQSGNPGGRPGKIKLWQLCVEQVGELKGKDVRKLSRRIAEALKDIPDEVTLREAAVLAAYADVINNTNAGMFNALADRAEGKPAQAITDEDGESLVQGFADIVRAAKGNRRD